MLNEHGLKEIREFLVENHKNGEWFADDLPDVTKALHGYAQEAERQIGFGNPPSIELKAWETVTGHTQEFRISDAGLDWALSPIDVYVDPDPDGDPDVALVSAKDANGVRLFSQMGIDDGHGNYGDWSLGDSGLALKPAQVEEIKIAVDKASQG